MELKSSSSKQYRWSLKALAPARPKKSGTQKLQLQLQEKKLELKAPALTLNLILESKSPSSNSDLILGLSIPARDPPPHYIKKGPFW